MTKRRGNKVRSRTSTQSISGRGPLNAALTATNAGGAFVSNRYQIDTTLTPSWTQLGQTFTYWKVKEITIHLDTIKGTNTDGSLGICVLPDVKATTPNTTSSALSQQFSKFGKVGVNLSLRYRPPLKKWLFTRDTTASTDDRLEMFGDIVIWSENCSASFIPAVPWIDYVVEFRSVSNATVTPSNKSSKDVDNNNVSSSSEDEADPIAAIARRPVVPEVQLTSFLSEKIGVLRDPMKDSPNVFYLMYVQQQPLDPPNINVCNTSDIKMMPFKEEMTAMQISSWIYSMGATAILVAYYAPPLLTADKDYPVLLKALRLNFVPFYLLAK